MFQRHVVMLSMACSSFGVLKAAVPSVIPLPEDYYEYWIDSDYGSRTEGSIVLYGEKVSMSIDLGHLAQGLHCFNFRTWASNGEYSGVTRQMFYYAPELAVSTSSMVKYETWFDSNYAGRKEAEATHGVLSLSFDLGGMKQGLHTFNFRPVGKGDAIGSVTRQMFYYAPELAVSTASMVKYETWFDSNYAGRKEAEATHGVLSLSFDLGGMKTGLHTFNFRPVGQGDATGSVTRKMFYLAPEEKAYATLCEYWIDDMEPMTAEVYGQNIDLDVDIASIPQGMHEFSIRLMGADGSWGTVHSESFEVGGKPLDASEWQYLLAMYKELGQMGWVAPWNISGGISAATTFEGVRIIDGHITAFDFSGKGLQGLCPQSLFLFPELKSIDLSHNNLSGGIDVAFALAAKQEPASVAKIETLDLSHNEFSGNVAILAAGLPSLTTLDVSYNCFGDIYPAISKNVTKLDFGHQTIDRVVPIDMSELRDMDVSNDNLLEMKDKLPPTITLYNHALGSWTPTNGYAMTTAPVEDFQLGATDDWTVALAWNAMGLTIPYVSPNGYIYYGKSGDLLNAIVLSPDPLLPNQYVVEGTNFKIQFNFADGDVNVDGAVNVMDLQSIINFIFELYNSTNVKPFNFTAANQQDADDIIDVKDAVVMVNLLLGKKTQPQSQTRAPGKPSLAFNADGQLCISSAKPVAAFEMSITGTDAIQMSPALKQAGFTCCIQSHDGGYTRLVAYSLSGSTLPAGVTSIGSIGDNSVSAVILSDADANAITEASFATDIKQVEGNLANSERKIDGVYNTLGQKVNRQYRGVVIRNGRKVIQ